MAAAAPVAPPDLGTPTKGPAAGRTVQPLRAGQGHSFLWRRLHSLSGIVPIGAFLVEHIVSNFETWNGPLAYAQQVKFLNALPLVRILEWGLIFIPLAFHALYGVFIAFRGRANVNVYPWASNWMYITQRVTGLIALRVHHPARLASAFRSASSSPSIPAPPSTRSRSSSHNPWMLAIYVIAMVATCWHFAYGIWLFAVKWGITPGDRARKRFGYVCAAIGSALCVMGLISIYAVVWKYPNAPADVMPAQPPASPYPPQPPAPGTTNPSQPGEVR